MVKNVYSTVKTHILFFQKGSLEFRLWLLRVFFCLEENMKYFDTF